MTTTPTRPAATRLRWLGFSLLILTVLLIMIDNTVLSLAMPFISKDLAATGTQMLWIGDVYSFVLAGLLVSMGTLGDRIGRKKLLLIGAATFGIASLIAAFAPTAEALIAARVLLGVGGATLMPSTLSLIRSLFPDPVERRTAIGIWSAAAVGGSALGPLVGGFLLEHFWWGSVFLINVPVVLVLVPAGALLLREAKNPDPGPWDLRSVFLSMIGMVGVVYAVKETSAHGVGLPVVISAVAGVAALWLFVRRQKKLPRPLIDLKLFRNPSFAGVIAANMLSIFGMSGLFYFFSQYFQLVQGYRPLMAGLAGLPSTLASIVVSVLAGALVARTSSRAVLAGGLALMGLAMIPMAFLAPDTSYPFVAVAMVAIGIGMAMTYTTANDLVLSSVRKEEAGAAAAISETGYELGMALGIATLGSIVTGIYQRFPVPAGTPADLAANARDSLAGAVEVSRGMAPAPGQQLLSAAQEAFTSGLAVACAAGAVLLLGAAVLAWTLLKRLPGEKSSGTREADVQSGG
ncbi:MFS transporter [Amycolatopsis jejuensis]|uniref:MFS transporter n=1 Tax=Amycolatopsis jejuensis TaxID=330084 RepID=UPI00068EFBDA|nr:MFS transporter [Amycolatopsis jejuensis]